MIQAPQQNYGMPQGYGTPQTQTQQRRPSFAPSYNAVQINLDTPTLNAPPAMPYYPPVNMSPYQPQAQPQMQPQATDVAPTQMPPQYQQPQGPYQMPQAPVQQAPAPVPAPVLEGTAPAQTPAQTQAPNVEVKPADAKGPDALAEEAFKGLSSADYDKQAEAMEEIAQKGLNKQEDVIPYVQENIFDKLIDIMEVDSSNLAGPTDRQIELRNKIAENDAAIENATKAGQDPATVKLPHQVSAAEEAEANTLSPFEQVERNKEYAMFTTAILQKTYADELQKQTGSVPPLTELPGAKAVITQLKTSPNPDMAVSAIDALRHVQRPEYKEDLTTLYTIAQNDARPEVVEAATSALELLNAPEQEAKA